MFFINQSENLTNYDVVTIYLKNNPTAKVTLSGKVISVDTDNTTTHIETDNNSAAFDTADIVSVVFGVHNASKG